MRDIKLLIAGILMILAAVTYLNYTGDKGNLNDLECGFTEDFQNFINQNGYSKWNFDRPDLKCPSFGGKSSKNDKIQKTPVIFIHGNSDVGFGRGTTDGYASWQTGFRSLATYLTSEHGYQKSELYTTTWGPANPNAATDNFHSKQYVTRMRAFVEAVLAYTGAKQVNIISHSMGVTLARQVIQGGLAADHVSGSYEVGPSLSSKVKTFVGIAGGNLGLTSCFGMTSLPACSSKDGFYPGSTAVSHPSDYLNHLNTSGQKEGDNVYVIWSKYDNVLLYGCMVWGKITCRIPAQTGEIEKTTSDWDHFKLRDSTGPDMIDWL